MASEYRKKELTFQVNSFKLPKTLKEVEAWANQIIALAKYEPGCLPDLPDAGLAIDKAQYQDLENYAKMFKVNLEDQINRYLPDIPISNLDVYGQETKYGHLLVIAVEFSSADINQTVYLKGLKSGSNRLFEFEINF
jgi:hypothetical protein